MKNAFMTLRILLIVVFFLIALDGFNSGNMFQLFLGTVITICFVVVHIQMNKKRR